MDRRSGEVVAGLPLLDGRPRAELRRALGQSMELRRAPQEEIDRAPVRCAHPLRSVATELEHRPRPERAVALAHATVDHDRQLRGEHARLNPLADPGRRYNHDLDVDLDLD